MDKLLKQFSIQEVSQKTHISPVMLEKLLNYDFEKIDTTKLKGFITILEEEYPHLDFSELKDKIDEYVPVKTEEIVETVEETNSNFKIYLFVFILLALIAGLVMYMKKENKKIDANITTKKTITNMGFEVDKNIVEINNTKVSMDKNKTEENKTKPQVQEPQIKEDITPSIDIPEAKPKSEKKAKIKTNNNLTLAIIPLKRVWYKVTYLDSTESKEHLTSREFDFNVTQDLFVKFGHGMVELKCGNNTLEPNSTKITRVIITKNCDMKVTTKKVKEFE